MPAHSTHPPATAALPFLGDFGDRAALITATETLTYAQLQHRVEEVADQLGSTRRLVLLVGANHVDALVGYLAALTSGHPVIVVPGDRAEHVRSTIAAYDPDVVMGETSAEWSLSERRTGTAHDLHPSLALLLSTSGSTGSPKLVRLSYENVRSNAESIADYLGISEADCAPTGLPLHYCYGLSVVHSHLVRGASLAVTDTSVVDPEFWSLFRSAGATSLAGVPFTFELLDRCGFAEMDLPHLRYVTQAGGPMRPRSVVRYAELGQRRGWDLVVMYGATEATARMAYLPPELALTRPSAVGIAIPGGQLRIEPAKGSSEHRVGELVYTGPNVMMGYADGPEDLADGGVLAELRTGDIARQADDGLFEVIGRKNRLAKVFGQRINLVDLESQLADQSVEARCVAVGEHIVVNVRRYADVATARSEVARFSGLPPRVITSTFVERFPTLTSGKTDYALLERHAAGLVRSRKAATAPGQSATPRPAGCTAEQIRALYAELLGRPDATTQDSFTSLGGDSLSYVEVSIRLADAIDELPRDWHTLTVERLAASGDTSAAAPARPQTRWSASAVDTSLLLRAIAIVLIVGTHANLLTAFGGLYGGAHLLLAVAGYNYARFKLAGSHDFQLLSGLSAITQVAVPSALWIGAVSVLTGFYTWPTALFLNGWLGSDAWTDQWQFWFLDALVWTLLLMTGLMSIPAVFKAQRRRPWMFALGALSAALAVRYAQVGLEADPLERYMVLNVAWLFTLGWAIAVAKRTTHRLILSAGTLLSVIGFFGMPEREALIVGGLLVLLWVPTVRLPRPLTACFGLVANASLYIYLTHWQVYPHLEVDHPLLAVGASIAIGIAAERLARPLTSRLSGAFVAKRHRPVPGPTAEVDTSRRVVEPVH